MLRLERGDILCKYIEILEDIFNEYKILERAEKFVREMNAITDARKMDKIFKKKITFDKLR